MSHQVDRSSSAFTPDLKQRKHLPVSILAVMLASLFIMLAVGWLTVKPISAQARGSISPAQNIFRIQSNAPAAIRTVTNTNNSGVGSLRAALSAANAGDTIQFSLPDNSIITVTNELTVTKFVIINGATATNLSVSGNNATRVFSVTAPATFISFKIIKGNTAGNGGGLYSTSALTLTTMQFLSNTGNNGGGVYASAVTTLTGGLFQNNTASYGGGLYTGPNSVWLSSTQFLSNTAGFRHGGGVYASGPVALTGGLFQNNSADLYGGGLYAYSTLALSGPRFFSNTSYSAGGGVYVSGTVTLNGGAFENNSSPYGGGLYAHNALGMSNTQFLSNTAKISGGGATVDGAATLNGGLFQNNQALNNSAGGLHTFSTLALTGTRFISNTAQYGGGLYHEVYEGGITARIVNTLFARNVATSTFGAAMYLSTFGNSGVQILHTTIARPTLGSGSAIYIELYQTGTVGITDTIISNYSIGISRTAGTVFENYNLFFGNTSNKSGTIGGGTYDVIGDPSFVNPASDNFHLKVGAAIGRGINAGVNFDLDGNPRPGSHGFDIGAYQYIGVLLRVYLPLALKNF
jgi:predicted outer membrane repeat protein